MRRWWPILAAIVALPMLLWLLFAALVWLDGDWQADGYAVGWTFNMAILSTGFLVAVIAPSALILFVIRSVQGARARKRGWR